jgi:hypothetical protein
VNAGKLLQRSVSLHRERKDVDKPLNILSGLHVACRVRMIKALGYDQTTPQDWPKQAAVTNSGDRPKQLKAELIARESGACDHGI